MQTWLSGSLSLPSILCLCLLAASANGDCVSVLEVVERPEFSSLEFALSETDLKQTLQTTGTLTLFAPTDTAVQKLTPEQLGFLFDRDNRDELRDALLYHLVRGDALSVEDLKFSPQAGFLTVNGKNVCPRAQPGLILNQNTRIVESLPICNGIVHVIDNVLIPPDEGCVAILPPSPPPPGGCPGLKEGHTGKSKPYEVSTRQGDTARDPKTIYELLSVPDDQYSFSNFLEAVDLGTEVRNKLSDNTGEYTLFLPTNTAFDFISPGVWDSLEGTESQQRILKYHLVPGRVTVDQLFNNNFQPNTVLQDPLCITVDETDIFIDRNALVLEFDQPALNGLIHIIDRVLFPNGEGCPAEECPCPVYEEPPADPARQLIYQDRFSNSIIKHDLDKRVKEEVWRLTGARRLRDGMDFNPFNGRLYFAMQKRDKASLQSFVPGVSRRLTQHWEQENSVVVRNAAAEALSLDYNPRHEYQLFIAQREADIIERDTFAGFTGTGPVSRDLSFFPQYDNVDSVVVQPNNRVYFSSFSGSEIRVQDLTSDGQFDGPHRQVYFNSTLDLVDFAIDHKQGFMYLANPDAIYRTNFPVPGPLERVARHRRGDIRAITVEPIHGTVFWASDSGVFQWDPIKNEKTKLSDDPSHSITTNEVDECFWGLDDCAPGQCVNTWGSYVCGYKCDAAEVDCGCGWKPTPEAPCRDPSNFGHDCWLTICNSTACCEDIDECEEGLDTCPNNGRCINTIGSFICEYGTCATRDPPYECPLGYHRADDYYTKECGDNCFLQQCCDENVCKCPYGVAALAEPDDPSDGVCEEDGARDCVQCFPGYHLSTRVGPGQQRCLENTCIEKNTAGEAVRCPSGTREAQNYDQICGCIDCDDECCQRNVCSCDQGVPATWDGLTKGTKCEVDGSEDCQACDDGYDLVERAQGQQTCELKTCQSATCPSGFHIRPESTNDDCGTDCDRICCEVDTCADGSFTCQPQQYYVAERDDLECGENCVNLCCADRTCVSEDVQCADGYHQSENYFVNNFCGTNCNGLSPVCCSINVCTCTGGTATTGTDCGNHQDEDCSACLDAYHFRSPAGDGNQACYPNTCVEGPSGVGDRMICPRGWYESDAFETVGVGLSGSDFDNVALQTCCEENICSCDKGNPSVFDGAGDSLCEQDGNEDCVSCDAGYHIENMYGLQQCEIDTCGYAEEQAAPGQLCSPAERRIDGSNDFECGENCNTGCCEVNTCGDVGYTCSAANHPKPDSDDLECRDDCDNVCCEVNTCLSETVECTSAWTRQDDYLSTDCGIQCVPNATPCCRPKVCVCPNGTPSSSGECLFDGMEDCVECQIGYNPQTVGVNGGARTICVPNTCGFLLDETQFQCNAGTRARDNAGLISCGVECSQSVCCQEQTCAEFPAVCNTGYRERDQYEDIRCGLSTSPCSNNECCKDIDECAEDSDDCPQNGGCINTIGSFQCIIGTCADISFQCPSGTRAADGYDTIECGDDCIADVCCEEFTTCAEAGIKCGVGFQPVAGFDTDECAGDVCSVGNCCESLVCTAGEVEVDSFALGASQNDCRDVSGTSGSDCAQQISGESFQSLGSTSQWGWRVGPETASQSAVGTSVQVADAGKGGSRFDLDDGFKIGISTVFFGPGACGPNFPHSVNPVLNQFFIEFERTEGVRTKARNFFLDKLNLNNFAARFQQDPDGSPSYEDQVRSRYLKRADTVDFICYDMLQSDEPRINFIMHEKSCVPDNLGDDNDRVTFSFPLVVGGASVSLLGFAGFYRMRSMRKRRAAEAEETKTETEMVEDVEGAITEDGSTPPPLETSEDSTYPSEA